MYHFTKLRFKVYVLINIMLIMTEKAKDIVYIHQTTALADIFLKFNLTLLSFWGLCISVLVDSFTATTYFICSKVFDFIRKKGRLERISKKTEINRVQLHQSHQLVRKYSNTNLLFNGFINQRLCFMQVQLTQRR